MKKITEKKEIESCIKELLLETKEELYSKPLWFSYLLEKIPQRRIERMNEIKKILELWKKIKFLAFTNYSIFIELNMKDYIYKNVEDIKIIDDYQLEYLLWLKYDFDINKIKVKKWYLILQIELSNKDTINYKKYLYDKKRAY